MMNYLGYNVLNWILTIAYHSSTPQRMTYMPSPPHVTLRHLYAPLYFFLIVHLPELVYNEEGTDISIG